MAIPVAHEMAASNKDHPSGEHRAHRGALQLGAGTVNQYPVSAVALPRGT